VNLARGDQETCGGDEHRAVVGHAGEADVGFGRAISGTVTPRCDRAITQLRTPAVLEWRRQFIDRGTHACLETR
jgi:hypothetical protein